MYVQFIERKKLYSLLSSPKAKLYIPQSCRTNTDNKINFSLIYFFKGANRIKSPFFINLSLFLLRFKTSFLGPSCVYSLPMILSFFVPI